MGEAFSSFSVSGKKTRVKVVKMVFKALYLCRARFLFHLRSMNDHPKSRTLLFLRSLQAAFKALSASDPLRLAGATAFFTTFALPAILIIILSVLRLIFIPRNISRRLFRDLEALVGQETTQDIIHTLRAFRSIAENWLIAIGGFIFLLFVATTLF